MKNVSRRQFIKISTAAAATGALYTACTKSVSKAKPIPVGLQLYSVRHDCEKDFVGTVEKVAAIGYQGVEFAGYYGKTAAEVKTMLDNAGLQCCGSHVQLNTLADDQIEQTLEFNTVIGNKYLVVPWIPEEDRQTVDDWKRIAEQFNALSEKATAAGMKLGYHNHGFEFEAIDGQLPWDVFAQNTSDEIILQLDFGNAMTGGGDALAALKRYPGRAITVHAKEYSSTNPKALTGEGEVPWQEIFEFCGTEGGTEWYIIEEEKDAYEPLEAVEICYNNFQQLRA